MEDLIKMVAFFLVSLWAVAVVGFLHDIGATLGRIERLLETKPKTAPFYEYE